MEVQEDLTIDETHQSYKAEIIRLRYLVTHLFALLEEQIDIDPGHCINCKEAQEIRRGE